MNKKGHIGIGLTIIFAILLMGGALFSFATSRADFSKAREEIRTLSHDFTYNEELAVAKLALYVWESIKLNRDSTDFETGFESTLKQKVEPLRADERYGDLFGKILNDDGYALTPQGKEYVLVVTGVKIKNSAGQSTSENKFDVTIIFNKEKVLSVERRRVRFINE